MYRVIRSSDEASDQSTMPYAENILQDCVKNGTLVPAKYYNNRTGESYNFMYVKSVNSKSGNVYMCPVSVGSNPDVLLFDSSSKIKVSLSQIELGTDRTELKWENVDPKFTLDYVVNKTKQWLNRSLPKLVGRVAPVLSRRYLSQNRYGQNLWIEEEYEYVMLVDKADYDVKTDKSGLPNFTVNLTGHFFDVSAAESYKRYKAWRQSDSLYPYYLGYDSTTVPLESVAIVTYPGSSADFPSKDIVLNTVDNLNLSKDETNYVMSELVRLAERGSRIPSRNNSSMEAWLITYGNNNAPFLMLLKNGKVFEMKYNETVVFWKDNNGYAVQYRKSLFYLADAEDMSDDDVARAEYMWDNWYIYSDCVDLNKVREKLLSDN